MRTVQGTGTLFRDVPFRHDDARFASRRTDDVVIPMVVKWLRIDPALASTMLAATLTDCHGFFVFLGLASLFL